MNYFRYSCYYYFAVFVACLLVVGSVHWDVAMVAEMVAVVEVVVVVGLASYFRHPIQALVEPFHLRQ